MLKYPNQSSTSALTLIPRQVMMIDSKSKDKKKSTSLNCRNVLIVSIAEFLEANGFKKSLSKFRSESKLESDSKVLGINLEELVCKYLESSCSNEEKGVHGNGNVVPSNEETSTKVLKKKENTSTYITAKVELERNVEVKEKKQKEKKSLPVSAEETIAEDNVEAEEKKKEKKKKKETTSEPVSNSQVNEIEKKNKKHKITSDKCDGDTETVEADENHEGKKKKKKQNKADAAVDKLTQNKSELSKVDSSGDDDNTEKESHKKRKRSEFDSNKETGEDDPSTAKKVKSEKSIENSNLSNGKTENGELEGHTASKSYKKEKQSREPKTVNAFQRVKVEEVKFVDERLQDNSYWALDEKGSGYGAKAQEVLGQVRGRDFRHEKTKKKRGSYRGGQIDLDSHSIKFNYSDEE